MVIQHTRMIAELGGGLYSVQDSFVAIECTVQPSFGLLWNHKGTVIDNHCIYIP